MSAAVLPNSASDAIARMAAGVAPYTHLAVTRPTVRDFLVRHGVALLRLAVPVVRMFIDTRTRLGSARDTDDVWTAVEEMHPRAKRLLDLARDDGWAERARDIPKPNTPNHFARPHREPSTHLLDTKYEYFIDLFLSSPYTGRERSTGPRREADVPPFLRRMGGYARLMPTLLLALDFDAILPMLSDEARSIVHRAADEALEQLISFALAIDGHFEPPPGVTLPEPMPVSKLYDEWERILQLRRASDVAS